MDRIVLNIIQSDVEWGNPAVNISRMKRKIDSLPDGPSIVIIPELWTCSYDNCNLREHSLSSPEALEMLKAESRKKSFAIIGGSIPWQDPSGALFNKCHVIDDSGSSIGSYDKAHLFPLLDEPHNFRRGERPFLFNLYGLAASVSICFDIRFPEFIRSLALSGTDILFVPAQWPAARIDHWTALLKARAIENQMFVIGCNRCGIGGGDIYGGHSIAVAPDGTVLGECNEEDETIMAIEIIPSLIGVTRKKLPFTGGRNPALYSPITSLH